jgi:hypothetical protein
VRGAEERAKPAADRLPEYAPARLPLLEKTLLDARPVERELETLFLAFWASKTREYLTPTTPTRTGAWPRKPEQMAGRLVAGTKLADRGPNDGGCGRAARRPCAPRTIR